MNIKAKNTHAKLTILQNNAYSILEARQNSLKAELGRDLVWEEIDILPERIAYKKAFDAVQDFEMRVIKDALKKASKLCPASYMHLLTSVKESGMTLQAFIVCYQTEIFKWSLELKS